MPNTPITAEELHEQIGHAQQSLTELAKRAEKAVQDGLEQLRAQSKTYSDAGRQQLDDASRYVSGQVQERPLTATLAAVGVGVLVGFLLSTSTRR